MDSTALRWVKPIAPYRDESLVGFLGRWARENGFDSRRELLWSLQMPCKGYMDGRELSTLAAALGIEVAALIRIAPSDDPAYSALRRSLMRGRSESVCPNCLSEALYSRQLWSHAMSTCCPVHGTRLIDHCQVCHHAILSDRLLPHICDGCGSDLRQQTPLRASDNERRFNGLLTGSVPAEHLEAFSIGEAVPADIDLFILGVAKHFHPEPLASGRTGRLALPKDVDGVVTILTPAMDLFSPWPTNIDRRLHAMLERQPNMMTTGVAKRLGGWYSFLFRKFTDSAYEPWRIVAANRITETHAGVLNARTHCVQSKASIQKKWYSVAEAARELGVSAERLHKGIDAGSIEARCDELAAGYRQRFLSAQEIARLCEIRDSHIDNSAAREKLGVSKGIFRLVCEAGWIVCSDPKTLPPVTSGFVQVDELDRLMQRLHPIVEKAVSDEQGVVALRDLTLRRTTDRQRLIGVYQDIASGAIRAVGSDVPGIGGLLFLQTDVDERLHSTTDMSRLTLERVSDLTGAHYDAVKGWVSDGILVAMQDKHAPGSPWLVDLPELIKFLMAYTPLAALATSAKTTSRGLQAKLHAAEVPVIQASTGRGLVVKIRDIVSAL